MNTSLQSLPLGGGDLRELVDLLLAELATFFHFTESDLYFPPARSGRGLPAPDYIPAERTLLLPLCWQGRHLGSLRLKGVRGREMRPLLPRLPAIAALALESLAREKAAATDETTGLLCEREFFGRMARSAERVRAVLARSPVYGDLGASSLLHHLCMGMVVVRLANARAIAEAGGYGFLEQCLAKLAGALREGLEEGVVAARVWRSDFAILLPGVSGRGACQKLGEAALARMEAVDLDDPAVPGHVLPFLAAGHALFPQDMHHEELRLSFLSQARELLERARLTAGVAAHRGNGTCMPFVRILRDGGVVLRCLGMDRMIVNLGRRVQAREGLCFALGDPQTGRNKGDVVLQQVRESDAVAEIIHLSDPADHPEPGDTLTLLDASPAMGASTDLGYAERALEDERGVAGSGAPAQAAATSSDGEKPAGQGGAAAAGQAPAGCLSHGAFMTRFAELRAGREPFALALLRLDGGTAAGEEGAAGGAEGSRAAAPEAALHEAAALWAGSAATPGAFVGFYGVNGLVFCHPGSHEGLEDRYRDFLAALGPMQAQAAVGIASWPFLTCGRGEILSCVLRALEYALLLPSPRVGTCNSAAITIGADRRYSQGDVFGAVEEYRLALLADEGNALAWNSLGVCMAALGRTEEARRDFEKSRLVGRTPQERAQASYNLGTVCQQLGDDALAAAHYRDCLGDYPDHVFALIRLGQLEERKGCCEDALSWYEKAARAEHRLSCASGPERDAAREAGVGAGHNLSLRCLARMAVMKSRDREARQLLSEALRRDPDDSESMLMLARCYLDAPGAADIAELLARHCLSIAPRPAAWEVLARSLDLQGRGEEAAAARLKAGRA